MVFPGDIENTVDSVRLLGYLTTAVLTIHEGVTGGFVVVVEQIFFGPKRLSPLRVRADPVELWTKLLGLGVILLGQARSS